VLRRGVQVGSPDPEERATVRIRASSGNACYFLPLKNVNDCPANKRRAMAAAEGPESLGSRLLKPCPHSAHDPDSTVPSIAETFERLHPHTILIAMFPRMEMSILCKNSPSRALLARRHYIN
jgi:hypothetical protein